LPHRRAAIAASQHRNSAEDRCATRSCYDKMSGLVEEMLDQRHVLERALADLMVAYQRHPHPALAGTIEVVRAEIALIGTVLIAQRGS
jgi:hypothetical protein